MHYLVCRLASVVVSVVYIVICNTLRLIVGKIALRDVISTALCGCSHTNRYYETFFG